MSEELQLVLAAYQDTDAADADFDRLVGVIGSGDVASDGVVLVQRDDDGNVSIQQTGNKLGKRGAGWGGGVGVLVGLAAPPLLASVAVGAAAGGIVGKFAQHRVAGGLESGIGDKLQPGTSMILALVAADDLLTAEQALSGSPAKSRVEMDGGALSDLREALAEAAGKFNPDRTVLPMPDPPFGGVAGRTIGDSVADWTIIMQPKPPEGAPNVLVVLIDDAGYGNTDDHMIRNRRLATQVDWNHVFRLVVIEGSKDALEKQIARHIFGQAFHRLVRCGATGRGNVV
jgi:arylsulfatase